MHGEPGLTNHFTDEMIEKIARLWSHTPISLIDVRSQWVHSSRPIENYRMPSSMLVYTFGGSADIKLNHVHYSMNRFGIFHGGKGTELSIWPSDVQIHAVMVLYKPESPSFYKKEVLRLLDQINPFIQLYGYSPKNPIQFQDKFQQMLDSWQRITAMNQFRAKNLLYQIIYDIYKDMQTEGVHFLQPDPVSSAKQYLNEHYTEPILFQEIADMFSISNGQLTRLFKKKEGMGLQEYLIQKRLEVARTLLINTESTIKEIALGCGFIDEKNLFRMFRKHYKMTPNDYRKINALRMPDYGIDNDSHHLYNEEGLGNLVKIHSDGELTMFGQTRSKEVFIAAMMSLMLLLSACSGATPVNNGASSGTSAQTQQVQSSGSTEKNVTESTSQTRKVSTIMGEIEIPSDPERVVVNWYAGDAVTLGLNIVGTTVGQSKEDSYNKLPYWEELSKYTFIEKWEPEDVMALEPDLIITHKEEDFDKFKNIAPVLVISGNEMTPTERLKFLGEATGRGDIATQVLDNFETKLASAKQLISSDRFKDQTFTINQDWGSTGSWAGIGFESESRGGTLLYNFLGTKLPDKVQALLDKSGDDYAMLSYEVAHEYFGDYVLWFESPGKESEYQKTEIWNSIPAVTNQKVAIISTEEYGLFFFSDVAAMTAQLDYITNLLQSLEG
ncbi:AraC family transcriptional regulator [Paenibacillus sp. DCT19]|uniref:AraC family transcriptional regulator n=1 Tax=Paenibacillus sp. DCT19 TaxID=2211212 RepID=UPI000FE1A0D4|nr:helix-turn-helix domain-containing protein [Paenibacillus sp. DCT19]